MRLFPFALLSLAAAGLAACQSAPQADVSNAGAIVELRDYSVKPSVPSVAAGTVKIGVRNLAGMTHDLVVLKTDIAQDKLQVDGPSAKAKEEGRVGSTDAIGAGQVRALTLDLNPGNYVLICNIAGHYQLGMHVAFKVD